VTVQATRQADLDGIMQAEKLERAEVEAIQLARELRAEALLLDEQRAVEYARSLQLNVVRTPSIYVAARKAGWIDSVRERLDRLRAARYGLSVADLQEIVSYAIGGENVAETVEGQQRFPINVRYPRELRDSVEKLRRLPIVTDSGQVVALSEVADVSITDGPAQLRSENARLSGWIYVDVRGRDLGSFVREARAKVAREVALPPGHTVSWSGQFEYLERAAKRLAVVVPATLAIILLLLYLTFRRFDSALLVMASVPFALVGGVWLVYALGHSVSVASAVGFIALAGLAAEFGVVMILYLDQAIERWSAEGHLADESALAEAISEGAVLRVRPKAMTVAVILAGLAPLFFAVGAGSETMQRIAAPMIGGMISAPLLSMFLMPAAYLLLRRRTLRLGAAAESAAEIALART